MKTLKTQSQSYQWVLALLLFIFLIPNVNAQFLNKLKKRVEQKVENAVIEKAANKAADKATQSMDKMFDVNPFGGAAGKEKADPALVADTYQFSWKYSLKMSTKDGDMVVDYYLQPDEPYFGFTTQIMENMFTVMDNGKKVTIMYMKSDDNNIGMVTQMPEAFVLEDPEENQKKLTFEKLPEKTVNGYLCKGVKATNEDLEMIMYFTDKAEVSFDDVFKNSKTKIPVELKDYFNPDDKILMMSMDYTDLKNKKRNGKIECVGLEKATKTINKSDYKFM